MVRIYYLTATLIVTTGNFPKAQKKISMAEVARHNKSNDCWMEINGKIYDVSEYSQDHKAIHEYDYSKWCGKAATKGWLEKDGRERSHNRKARLLLKDYQIGEK